MACKHCEFALPGSTLKSRGGFRVREVTRIETLQVAHTGTLNVTLCNLYIGTLYNPLEP